MTRKEKECEIEPSQQDVAVDHPPDQPGVQENQPAMNLPQPNVRTEAWRLQPLSEEQEHDEDANTVAETPTQSSSEVERCAVESSRQTLSANSRMEETKSEGTESDESEGCRNWIRISISAVSFIFSLVLSIASHSEGYLDVIILYSVMSFTWLMFSIVERGKFHSTVTDILSDHFPRFYACCIEVPGTPRHASRFRRVDTNTNFVHEVADTSNPDEMPRIVYRHQETDVSSSDHQPESPNTVVSVDVHTHAAAPQDIGGACGYEPPEGRTSVYSSSDSGGEGLSHK